MGGSLGGCNSQLLVEYPPGLMIKFVHQTLSVEHPQWGQGGIQGSLCVEADSRGAHPEMYLGIYTLLQDSYNFIIPGSLGG